MFMPIPPPRSFSGNERLNKAKDVPRIIAAPIPVTNRAVINWIEEVDKAEARAVTKYIIIPIVKTFLTPMTSAILPKGTRNMEAARKNAVVSHPMPTESIWNSMPIVGVATSNPETIKGATNDPPADTNRRYLLLEDITLKF